MASKCEILKLLDEDGNRAVQAVRREYQPLVEEATRIHGVTQRVNAARIIKAIDAKVPKKVGFVGDVLADHIRWLVDGESLSRHYNEVVLHEADFPEVAKARKALVALVAKLDARIDKIVVAQQAIRRRVMLYGADESMVAMLEQFRADPCSVETD